MTVKYILSLAPCAAKWKEFRCAIGDKKSVTLLEIAEASGPHGLLWVMYGDRRNSLPKRWKPLERWSFASRIDSGDPAHRKPKWSSAPPAPWTKDHDEGMRIVRKVLGVRAAAAKKQLKPSIPLNLKPSGKRGKTER